MGCPTENAWDDISRAARERVTLTLNPEQCQQLLNGRELANRLLRVLAERVKAQGELLAKAAERKDAP